MTEMEKERAAAVCESCEEIIPVRITPDGGIEPIGFSCDCGTDNAETLTVLNEEDAHLDAYEE